MALTLKHTYDNNGPLRGPNDDGIGYPPTEVDGLRRRTLQSRNALHDLKYCSGMHGYELLPPSELAARAGVAVSALHFYERQGLISSSRTSGNQRRYTRDTLRRVAFIKMSQRLGIPLARVRDALATLPADRVPTSRDWARLSAGWRSDLDDRILHLQRLRDNLADCIGCGCLSLKACALFNPGDTLSADGPGAVRL
jgi:MerR family transcriptional regulator, redox-sensitive transcriptional activator SoxR